MFYVYILKSERSAQFYKGFTSDPVSRLFEHNAGFSNHTKGKGPWIMVFLQPFDSKRDALIEEIRIKRLNKSSIDRLIKSDVNMVNAFWGNHFVG
ncbi:MAG: GIY-YIG nuclease family protein [Bacteroidetes bacterium]|nr:GIY-YIG nuclease family protein [Bacteroidota bacterium]